MRNKFIQPDWPAPSNIQAVCTTRCHGHSQHTYASFNLGLHCGDNPNHVAANRLQLQERLNLLREPLWLNQTHSTHVIHSNDYHVENACDGCYTNQINQACVVMTADCLPVLLCNRQGTEIAAIHAGWRGLANGILEKGLQHFNSKPDDILIWLGPAIGPQYFEVGNEVRERFISQHPKAISAFKAHAGKWQANLYDLARLRLNEQGITAIYGGELCTFSDKKRFYSYRRDGQHTGRLASLIWIQS